MNTKDQLEKHFKATEGRQILRFPPEPNGYLHLGHAKSIRLNFESAKHFQGLCYLRYDDTNPETESHEFIEQIQQDLRFLEYKPDQITYASDYFEEIYQFAVKLIEMEKAYICDQSQPDMRSFRQQKLPSPSRDRSKVENLRIFEEMRNGLHEQGKYCLRLRIDYKNSNPTLRDPVIYRIKYVKHPRTNKKWCIYPTYDFTHCICDSLENITFSLCSLEFEVRRDLYYWILHQLNLYKPMVWEFSRLNISFNLLSKRKIQQLVSLNLVEGWNDPRLYTLIGLQNRGIPQQAIRNFIDLINVARTGNENIISYTLLEETTRQVFQNNQNIQKVMAVLEPVELFIENFNQKSDLQIVSIEQEAGCPCTYKTCQTVFVERGDIRLEKEKDFFRIYPGNCFNLIQFGSFVCKNVELDQAHQIRKVICEKISLTEQQKKAVKGQLHWISSDDSVICAVEVYNKLLTVEDANQMKGELVQNVNRRGKVVLENSRIPTTFRKQQNAQDVAQFIRQGYFQFKDEKINRIVPLKNHLYEY